MRTACIILFITISVFSTVFSDIKDYNIQPDDPKNVTKAYATMLMKADYESMTNITELKMKKDVMDTLFLMKDQTARVTLIKVSERIISYEIINLEVYTNENSLALTSIKWTMKPDSQPRASSESRQAGGTVFKKNNEIVYIDYILKQFDNNEWKIISSKTR